MVFSCSDKNKQQKAISKINVDFNIKRFDVDFYSANKETLPKIKKKYPYLFPAASPFIISTYIT